jgi:hypothetical protein
LAVNTGRPRRRRASLVILLAAFLSGVVPVAVRSSLLVLTVPVALYFLMTAVVVQVSSEAEAR